MKEEEISDDIRRLEEKHLGRFQEEADGQNTKDIVQKFKAIWAWWRNRVGQNYKCNVKPVASISESFSVRKCCIDFQRRNVAKLMEYCFS